MKKFVILLSAVLLSCYSAGAEGTNISVERTAPNHTTIVIHNTSPEAYRERNERAREAGRRLELKRQRKHELELARIENQERQARVRQTQARSQAQQQPTIYRKKAHQPAAFMNGGRPTMGFGFGGFPTVGYGGYSYGYTPRPYAYRGRCRTRPVRSRGYRGNRCRPTRRVSRPVQRISRGRRCR